MARTSVGHWPFQLPPPLPLSRNRISTAARKNRRTMDVLLVAVDLERVLTPPATPSAAPATAVPVAPIPMETASPAGLKRGRAPKKPMTKDENLTEAAK